MAPLERLKTITASDSDGGLGADVEWAVEEIDRLTKALHDCQHELARYRASAQQTRGSVAEAEAMMDKWAADAAERGEG